ncbi:MAG: ABC transporter permease [Flavobacteriaceae bacterium]|nr:ABC transporter permease [Flavobacteriaceae bacterium]
MVQTWFKIFFRNSKKNWLNILVNILGLTLGFAGLLIVLLYLQDEQSYNAKNPNKHQIYRVIHKMSDGEVWDSSTNVEGPKYKQDIPEVVEYYLSDGWYGDFVVKIADKELFTTDMLRGNANFFDVFPFKIVEGSVSAFKKVHSNAAISEKQAAIYFGKQSAIGKTISYNGKSFTITTVYKIEGKHYFMPNVITQFKEQPEGSWGSFSKGLFLKTTKGADLKTITKKANDVWYDNAIVPQAKRDGISPKEFEEKYGTEIILEPLTDVRLKTIASQAGPEGKGNYQLIIILLSLSVLLILISCVNFINLSIASATQRAKEVGVKKTLGLSKTSLIRQYTLEIILQGIIAFLLSLVLVEMLLPSFNSFMRKDISLLNISLLASVGILAVFIAFFIGIIPAIYLAKFKSVEVLKGNINGSKQGVFARNLMLGTQFLISGFFLTGSLIINKQVTYMMEKDLGFKGDQVVMLSLNKRDNRYKKYLLAKNELIKHPNIEAVTSNSFTIGGGSSNSTNVNYKDYSVQTYANAVDYNFLDIMDIKVIKGRKLKEEIASDTISNILINETLAKSFNIYENPIGKKIRPGFGGNKDFTIVGMIKDYHITGLDAKIPPTMIFHWNTLDWMKQNFWKIQVKVKPDNVQETLKFIESYWKENIEQGYPFYPQFVNKRFARTYKKYQNQQTLFFILTSVVILVSLLGLFALATLTIQQRLKEVAIRKTLGASVKEIMYQLIKSFLKITVIASIILIPIAYYFIQNWLNNFVYRIEMPILPFIITPIILTMLVFIVVGLKAFNATKIDLIKYLKFE